MGGLGKGRNGELMGEVITGKCQENGIKKK